MIYTIKLIEIPDHLTQSADYQIILRIIFDLVYTKTGKGNQFNLWAKIRTIIFIRNHLCQLSDYCLCPGTANGI